METNELFAVEKNSQIFRASLFERPKALQERVFEKLFRQAEIAKYDDIERRQYEASLKEYWDYSSTMDTAHDKGVVEGIQKEKADTIHRLQAMGLTIEQIALGADMSIDDVRRMLK